MEMIITALTRSENADLVLPMTSVLGQQRKSRTTFVMSVIQPKAEVVCEAFVNPFRACASVCGGHVAACYNFTLRLAGVMLVTETSRGRVDC